MITVVPCSKLGKYSFESSCNLLFLQRQTAAQQR